MPSLITQVRSKLFINSSHPSMHQLDGAYSSLMHGRSNDFEDLREYQVGDQVRDIDWRASARLDTMLVKRTRAHRMHTVLFVVDTGHTMTALAPDERPKRDLAIVAAGALGFLTLRHGDDIGFIVGDSEKQKLVQGGRSEAALEHGLRTIQRTINESSAEGSIDALLDYVARNVSRRAIIVVIADEQPFTSETDRLVRRLRLQHDMLWLTIADADPVLAERSSSNRSDVMSGWEIPQFIHGDDDVLAEMNAIREAEVTTREETLGRWEISRTTLTNQDTAASDLLQMLNRRTHATR